MREYDNVMGLTGYTNIMMEKDEIEKIYKMKATIVNWEGNEMSAIWKCRETETGKDYFFVGDNNIIRHETIEEAISFFKINYEGLY